MKDKKENGLIHIYSGDGKGKTTAALGLALRAIGAGRKVIIIQFMKMGEYSEHKAIKKFRLPISIESYGIGYYKILGDKHSKTAHQKAAQKALEYARESIAAQKHDLIILDEINVAVYLGLIKIEEVIQLLTPKTYTIKSEIVLTGRHAHPKLKKTAHLITDMKKVKHYFDQGQKARRGIEY